MNRIKNAKRNIIWGLFNKIVGIIIPFILRTAVIYYLGREYLGLDSLFNSILQMLNIAELGFNSAIVFSMYKPLAIGNDSEVCALLGFYRRVYRIIGVIVLVLGLSLTPLLPRLIKSGLPKDVNLYLLYFIFLINTVIGYWLFAYKKSLISACQREDIISITTSTVSVIKIIIQMALLLTIPNYYIFIVVMPLATIAENITSQIITLKIFPQYQPYGSISKDSIKSIVTHIKGLIITRICTTSRNSMDSIIISAYLGLASVTIYGNYYYILASIHGILYTITHSISAIVGNTIVKNTPSSNYKDMLTFNFIYMWLASFCTTCLLCIYQPFMKIWMGDEMLLSNGIMVLFCVYFYGLCMGDIRSTYYVACGLWWEGRFRSIAEAITNIVLNILLGKYFGISGIVIATIISILVINFGYGSTIIHRYYFKEISSWMFYKEHLYYVFVTLISSAICLYVCSLHHKSGILCIAINFVICLILSNICFFIFCCRRQVFEDARRLIIKVLVPNSTSNKN